MLAPPILRMSPDAAEVWCNFYNHVEERCGSRNELEDVGDFAAKAAEHAARIAGVVFIIEDLHAKEIKLFAAEGAVELVNWYLNEADRLNAAGRTDPRLLRAQKLLEWLQGQPGRKAGLREILQLGACGQKLPSRRP